LKGNDSRPSLAGRQSIAVLQGNAIIEIRKGITIPHELDPNDLGAIAMRKTRLTHVNRRLTDEDRARHAEIRAAAVQDIPPKPGSSRKPSPPGIPAKIQQAREARGLTWYALAQAAGIPNQGTIRDIEQGRDVKLSSLQAVAWALGLRLDVVEQVG
jgi:hypothetical protein